MSAKADLLPKMDEAWVDRTLIAMNASRLSSTWAKSEILLGLAAVAVRVKLMLGDGLPVIAGGALMVLGGYLALAGNRSHLYQSQNRQTAYLLQVLTRNSSESE